MESKKHQIDKEVMAKISPFTDRQHKIVNLIDDASASIEVIIKKFENSIINNTLATSKTN